MLDWSKLGLHVKAVKTLESLAVKYDDFIQTAQVVRRLNSHADATEAAAAKKVIHAKAIKKKGQSVVEVAKEKAQKIVLAAKQQALKVKKAALKLAHHEHHAKALEAKATEAKAKATARAQQKAKEARAQGWWHRRLCWQP